MTKRGDLATSLLTVHDVKLYLKKCLAEVARAARKFDGNPKLLTKEELCVRFGLSVGDLRKYVKQGLSAVKGVGKSRRLYYNADIVEKWLIENNKPYKLFNAE
jgi:hypothetical protein